MITKPCKHCGSTKHQSFQCLFRPFPNAKPCKFCESKQHLSWQCYQNPKRQEQMKRKMSNGKQAIRWIITRKRWFRDNKQDYYICYLCGKSLTRAETTLDHIIPRSRAPELRYEFSNLAPCCWSCNSQKGSKVRKVIDKY